MGYITAFRLIKADYHRYSALAELGGGARFLKSCCWRGAFGLPSGGGSLE